MEFSKIPKAEQELTRLAQLLDELDSNDLTTLKEIQAIRAKVRELLHIAVDMKLEMVALIGIARLQPEIDDLVFKMGVRITDFPPEIP